MHLLRRQEICLRFFFVILTAKNRSAATQLLMARVWRLDMPPTRSFTVEARVPQIRMAAAAARKLFFASDIMERSFRYPQISSMNVQNPRFHYKSSRYKFF